MAITIEPAQDADMQQVFTIASRAFKRNEPFWDATFPEHWTEQGRVIGGQRFLQLKQTDPHMRYIKAVDTETGRIAGFARWLVYENHIPGVPENNHGSYWSSPEDADYFHVILLEFLKTRLEHAKKTDGNVVSLDICAVDPDYQRKGVGGKLVTWGTDTADRLGFDAVVESSVFGKGLYEKHGFVFERDVELPVPEIYKDRPKNKYAWLTRPKKVAV